MSFLSKEQEQKFWSSLSVMINNVPSTQLLLLLINSKVVTEFSKIRSKGVGGDLAQDEYNSKKWVWL